MRPTIVHKIEMNSWVPVATSAAAVQADDSQTEPNHANAEIDNKV